MSVSEKSSVPIAERRERRQTNIQILTRRLTSLSPIWTLILMAVVFEIASEGSFLRPVNLNNILIQSSTLAILATGMTFVLLTGEIDLSIAAVMGLTGMIAALLYQNFNLPEPLPVLIALAASTAL